VFKGLTPLLLVLALTSAACGASSEADGVASLDASVATTAAPETLEVDTEEAVLAFTECVREQGLDIEDPTFDEDGGFQLNLRQALGAGTAGAGPDEEVRAALDACREFLEGIGQRFDRQDATELEDQLLAFAECMRDEGIDMADPDLSQRGAPSDGGPVRLFGELDLDDPVTAAAFEACQDFFGFGPGAGPGPGGATAPGGNS